MRRFALVCIAAGMLAAGAAGAQAEHGTPPFWQEAWPDTDFSRHEVAFVEIISGGPPKDGIPPIDDPVFEAAAGMARPPADTEPVLSVRVGDDARAYPLSVMIWHEIVNDTVGGAPLAVTYCPLCNTGLVFRREVDGAVTTFGTTGKLRHSDLIMYDRASESWWQQYDGRAIVGARTGAVLERVAARLESFAAFRDRHPEGLVLVPNDPEMRPYGRNPYVGYDGSAFPFLYRGDYDGPGSPLMRVVTVEDRPEAWSLDLVRKAGRVEVDDLVITWQAGQASALDAGQIAQGRDVGTVLVRRAGEDVAHAIPFAFAFRAFHPDAPIHHLDP